MPTLYTHKEQNIRNTVILFAVFLAVIIALGQFSSYYFGNRALLYIAVVFSVGTSLVSYWFSDKIALSMAGAAPVGSREDNPYLWNMVENLAIAAGLPMPRLYVIPGDQINAFATGRDPQHSAIAVTAGAIAKLENEELEGVLAHELSHIGNRDILISTMAVILAGIISMVSDMFSRAFIWGGIGDRDNNRGNPIALVIGIALSLLAPLGAMLLQLAISRRREFLADTSGALLTRYPEGLANALEKIGSDQAPMGRVSEATVHLWISDPYRGRRDTPWWHKIFMTHPPIAERVAALRDMKV